MDILQLVLSFKTGTDEIAFVAGLGVLSFFYAAYRQCEEELEKEKMLEQFLKEST